MLNTKKAPLITKLQQDKKTGKKAVALLLDPDKVNFTYLPELILSSLNCGVDYFFVGGSLLMSNQGAALIKILKQQDTIPVVLFPGSNMQLDAHADGILLLSLISGRNPDLLIGQHVAAAPWLKRHSLEILSTGYMLIDSGASTSVSYMSNTTPIPADKPGIAVATAQAGEMLGLQLMYLDAGSGAKYPVNQSMVASVANAIDVPLLVGGGINTANRAAEALSAGADVIVVGNAIETNPNLLPDIMAEAKKASFICE